MIQNAFDIYEHLCIHVFIICSIAVCTTSKTLRLSIFFMCQIKIYHVVSFTRQPQLVVHCFVKNLYLKSSLRDGLYGIFKYCPSFFLAIFSHLFLFVFFCKQKKLLKKLNAFSTIQLRVVIRKHLNKKYFCSKVLHFE